MLTSHVTASSHHLTKHRIAIVSVRPSICKFRLKPRSHFLPFLLHHGFRNAMIQCSLSDDLCFTNAQFIHYYYDVMLFFLFIFIGTALHAFYYVLCLSFHLKIRNSSDRFPYLYSLKSSVFWYVCFINISMK